MNGERAKAWDLSREKLSMKYMLESSKIALNSEFDTAAVRRAVYGELCCDDSGEWWKIILLKKVQKRAIADNIEFDLLPDEVPERRMFCPVFTEMPLDYRVVGDGSGTCRDNVISVDRIDSNLGYVPGNIEIMSWRANSMKNKFSYDDHYKLVKHGIRTNRIIGTTIELNTVNLR